MVSQDFTIYAGDSRKVIVTVTDDNNNPVDLTGALIAWVAVHEQLITLTKTSPSGGININSPTEGQFTISLLATETARWLGEYQHEARVTDSDGNTSIVFTGTITVNKSYI